MQGTLKGILNVKKTLTEELSSSDFFQLHSPWLLIMVYWDSFKSVSMHFHGHSPMRPYITFFSRICFRSDSSNDGFKTFAFFSSLAILLIEESFKHEEANTLQNKQFKIFNLQH